MRDACRRFSFAREALQRGGPLVRVYHAGVDGFDGDDALEHFVVRLVDDAHGAAPDLAAKKVTAEFFHVGEIYPARHEAAMACTRKGSVKRRAAAPDFGSRARQRR